MIALPQTNLEPIVAARLALLQQGIDAYESYEVRVQRAAFNFAMQNRIGNFVFDEVKLKLDSMCSGARRCMYCEDSAADEVEHHHPKNLYPERTFLWTNYLYACGPCNGPKNNKFAVINEMGQKIDVTRQRNDPVVPPVVGEAALIDPRSEDPLQMLFLDIAGGTFLFSPHPLATPLQRLKGQFTIELLRLNTRDLLPVARREAYGSYLARMKEYVALKAEAGGAKAADLRLTAMRRMQHPTVLREMIRQAKFLPEVYVQIQAAPELSEIS